MHPAHTSEEYEGRTLNGDRQPVAYVDFDDALNYAGWLNENERLPAELKYRLPTEGEWVKYARSGKGWQYPWGNDWPPDVGKAGKYPKGLGKLNSYGAYEIFSYGDGLRVSCVVEKSWANPWGLYGVGGNVAEMTTANQQAGSFGSSRGCDWLGAVERYMRVSHSDDRSEKLPAHGFRLVLEP